MSDLEGFAAGDGNAGEDLFFINGTASPFVPKLSVRRCGLSVRGGAFFGSFGNWGTPGDAGHAPAAKKRWEPLNSGVCGKPSCKFAVILSGLGVQVVPKKKTREVTSPFGGRFYRILESGI
jgi:hypothetical protein